MAMAVKIQIQGREGVGKTEFAKRIGGENAVVSASAYRCKPCELQGLRRQNQLVNNFIHAFYNSPKGAVLDRCGLDYLYAAEFLFGHCTWHSLVLEMLPESLIVIAPSVPPGLEAALVREQEDCPKRAEFWAAIESRGTTLQQYFANCERKTIALTDLAGSKRVIPNTCITEDLGEWREFWQADAAKRVEEELDGPVRRMYSKASRYFSRR